MAISNSCTWCCNISSLAWEREEPAKDDSFSLSYRHMTRKNRHASRENLRYLLLIVLSLSPGRYTLLFAKSDTHHAISFHTTWYPETGDLSSGEYWLPVAVLISLILGIDQLQAGINHTSASSIHNALISSGIQRFWCQAEYASDPLLPLHTRHSLTSLYKGWHEIISCLISWKYHISFPRPYSWAWGSKLQFWQVAGGYSGPPPPENFEHQLLKTIRLITLPSPACNSSHLRWGWVYPSPASPHRDISCRPLGETNFLILWVIIPGTVWPRTSTMPTAAFL